MSTSVTTDSLDVAVDRDPATHCYRMRAQTGFSYSPYSGNTHCVQRLPGPKHVMTTIINDLQSWILQGSTIELQQHRPRACWRQSNPLGNMNMLGQLRPDRHQRRQTHLRRLRRAHELPCRLRRRLLGLRMHRLLQLGSCTPTPSSVATRRRASSKAQSSV